MPIDKASILLNVDNDDEGSHQRYRIMEDFMKEPTKEEYITTILNLINLESRMESFLPHCDQVILDQAISVLRFYLQFTQKRGQGITFSPFW